LVAVKEITVVAEDDTDRRYDYIKSGFPEKKPRIDAASWLGVKPDIPACDVEIIFPENHPIETAVEEKSAVWLPTSEFTIPVPEEEKRLYDAHDPNCSYPQYPYRKGRNKMGEFPVAVARRYFMDKGYSVWVSGQSKIGIPVFNLLMFPGARNRRDRSYLTMVNAFSEKKIKDFITNVEREKKLKGLRRNGGDPDLFVQNPQNPDDRFFVEVKAEDPKRRYKDKLNEQQLFVFPFIEKELMCEVRLAKVRVLAKL
jgi:hypothetical protein